MTSTGRYIVGCCPRSKSVVMVIAAARRGTSATLGASLGGFSVRKADGVLGERGDEQKKTVVRRRGVMGLYCEWVKGLGT